MSNPMFNPRPNYSGVTIQITNPAVNVNPYGVNPASGNIVLNNGNYADSPQACYCDCGNSVRRNNMVYQTSGMTNPVQETAENEKMYSQKSYPAEYYMNNYGEGVNNSKRKQESINEDFSDYASKLNSTVPDRTSSIEEKERAIEVKKQIMAHPNCPPEVKKELQQEIKTIETEINRLEQENSSNSNANKEANLNRQNSYIAGENQDLDSYDEVSNKRGHTVDPIAGISPYKDYAESVESKQPEDMTASKTIIGALDDRNAEIKEAKKNTKETKIIALTDEYIMSLENYLNNPNDEIRLMASKEILTRLDEDKDRYDDAALNALLNKMLQDPSKLIRLAALSAFASQLACGNDYTVQLLQNIQSNPNADKEDALQAADILLKMSAGVQVKNVPVNEEKREQYKMKENA